MENNNNDQLSLVVLNYNDYKTTLHFLNKISHYSCINHIVVVDNCSSDDSYEHLCEIRNNKIDVIKSDKNGGYGYGNNFGFSYLWEKYKPKYVAISNPDVDIDETAIIELLNIINNKPNCGVIAPIMKMMDGRINYKCVWGIPTFYEYLFFSLFILGKFFNKFFYTQNDIFDSNGIKKVGCVAGSFLIVDSNKFNICKGYDESIFLYCEETVLGIKMQKCGFDTLLYTNCEFIHQHSVSINKNITSLISKRKIMWESRKYVLQNYYKTNIFRTLLIHLTIFISIIETRILSRH